MKLYTFLLLGIFSLLYKDTIAQQPYFEEQNFPSAASGINLVNGIVADANNCVWLTTQSGVYRYDGNDFKHYSTLNTPAIKFERMESIQRVLRNRKLDWCIRDAKDNLYRVDSASRFQSFETGKNTEIVFGSYSLEVWKRGKKIAVSIGQGQGQEISEVFYCRTPNQFYMVLQNGGIATISSSGLFNKEKMTLLDSSVGLKNRVGKFFATDNNFYFSTPRGFFRYNNTSALAQAVEFEGDIRKSKNEPDYESMYFFLPAGTNSILLWHKGNIYELTESAHTNSLNTRLLAKGSPANVPSFLFYSPVHHLLMGCFLNKGLVLYRPRQFSLLTYSDAQSQLSLNYYYALLVADSGYITINNTGIVWLGLNGASRVIAKGNFNIFFLHRDKAGNIWYQKNKTENKNHDEVRYLEAGTNRSVYVCDVGQSNMLSGIYQFNDSVYYMLTNRLFQKLIYKEGKAIAEPLHKPAKNEEFNFIYTLDSSRMWIGYDQGLLEFNVKDQTIKPVTALGKANVRSVKKLAENNYIVGTYDKWIYQYKDGKWLHLSATDKTVASSAHAFVIDSFSNSLWLSSNKGVSRVSLKDIKEMNSSANAEIYVEQFTDFGEDISVEFNGSSNVSAAQISDSSAAFANATGIVIFNPRMTLSPPLPRNVMVELVNNNDSVTNSDNTTNQLQFRVIVPYFGNRGNLQVLYKLTNADKDWNLLFTNDVISYKNLKPGSHDLQFRIRHYSDIHGEEVFITAKSFYIPYKWYQTSWFKAGVIIFSLLLLISFHNFRIWYILKRKRELEGLVKMKTIELHETNENQVAVINELSLSEASLKQSNFLKDEYYAVLTHDLRSPLKFLSFNISRLLELLPDLKHDELKKGLFTAYQCSTDVSKLIDEFVYWIQDNEKQLKTQPSPSNIRSIIEDAKKIYGYGLDGINNSIVTDVPVNFIFATDPKILFIILRNAVDNANKYTAGGVITIDAVRQDDNLLLTVSDNGRGMSEDITLHLTNLQYADVQLSYKQRKSLGFYIMAMLTKKLGGHYTITSTIGKGTTLRFTIPELKE